ncbi:hypothetical protein RZA67_13285 [Stenotrophomonas sp. C3(2023)]|uniref:hypothetical protein n=1 Tax=Stenotrophomonas sp. C3(2023) TaxID=3080277 RepID=UPI00293D1B8F|nr:hypothetical protein [Stenotrophomonas sp. C3(2023)]MDV3469691.1 hypothetical protein [Stenotrophomonas sp. C3(2023)]
MADQLQTVDVARQPSVLDGATAEAMAGVVLRLQGPCRIFLAGAGLDALAAPLRASGCVVVSMMELATTSGSSAVDNTFTPLVDATADVAVFLSSGQEVPPWVLQLAVDSLVLFAPRGVAKPVNWWQAATASGWALHTASWVMQETVAGHSQLALGRAGVGLDSPEAILQANVFSLAAALVRPGDDVLLHAPGATDAWRIVRDQSRCGWLGVSRHVADVEDPDPDGYVPVSSLSGVNGRRTDFLLLVDVPSGEQAAGLFAQAGRVLRRSGRLLVERSSPEPADWEKYEEQLKVAGFAVDRAWLLRGGDVVSPAQRIELDLTQPIAPQWASDGVLVLMAISLDGTAYPQLPDSDMPNIVAFQRDYLDASVVRLIVAIGYRIESVSQRRAIAVEILEYAPPGSADQGAALCVLLYDSVAMAGEHGGRIQQASQAYVAAIPPNPTALRWQISIAYVLGRRCQSEGDLESARRWYERVLAQDVLAFSPLLGTKTTSAALSLGWLAFSLGDISGARSAWQRGIEEARRLAHDSDWREVVGDPACPETFGMPEFAAVMDEAASAANALRLTAETPLRRGLVWDWANRSWRQQIVRLQQELARHRAWQDELQQGKDWLHSQYEVLTAEVARLSADHAEMHGQHEGALAASRLAHKSAEESLQRQRSLYADLSAAYRLAYQRAERQFADQQDRYGDLLATYRLAHEDKQRLRLEMLEERRQLEAQLAQRERLCETEREEAAARLASVMQAMAGKDVRYQDLYAAYRLANRYNHERIALLRDRYAGAIAAYRTARNDAQRGMAGLQTQVEQQRSRADDLQRQLARLGDDHDSHRDVHARLVEAADGLGRACGRALGDTNTTGLQGDQLAREMDRLAAIIDSLPMKPVLRVMFRLWRRVSRRLPR